MAEVVYRARAVGDEIVEKRGRSSKTFDLGGNRRRVEIVCHAHHLVRGLWVDTICDWKNSTREYLSGQYPYVVKVNKGNLAVTILREGETVPVSLAPVGHNRKAEAVYVGNTVTIPGLWTGVDLQVVLTPEQPVIGFVKTQAAGTNPALNLTGLADPAPMLVARYTDELGHLVDVPATLQYGTVTYDLSGVPVGVVVN